MNDAPRLLRCARCKWVAWENHRRYGAVGVERAFSQLPLLEGSSIVWCGVADRNRFPYRLWRCDYYRDTSGGYWVAVCLDCFTFLFEEAVRAKVDAPRRLP